MIGMLWRVASRLKARFEEKRLERRWASLRAAGMHIGKDVLLPASTFIDTSHCFLISIGDHTGLGPECLILAHDAQMDEFLDIARIGRVIIHESCHIGARTTILAGVEIGPRTIVGANSVITKSLPPDSVCAGNPCKVICSLDEYLARHRERLAQRPSFDYARYDINALTPERRAELVPRRGRWRRLHHRRPLGGAGGPGRDPAHGRGIGRVGRPHDDEGRSLARSPLGPFRRAAVRACRSP
ncbi:MAG: acyltransferase [Gemmatimonadetes bacterium]|nr:acyltransferase [Gemmatimonadota bacterium]